MKARIRNRLDDIVEKMYADASVADQLAFERWSSEQQGIARRAVALEIDKAGGEGSDADSKLDEAIEAIKIIWGELKANLPDAVKKPDAAGDIARARVLALVFEVDTALVELTIAAEAEPE